MAAGDDETQVQRRAPIPAPTPSAPSTPPPTGAARVGRYALLFQIARGGMATVHAARLVGSRGVGRLVALKRLASELLSEDDQAAFLVEARLTTRIHHPNVVETLELVEEEGAAWLAMELVDGVSLARLLHRLAEKGERLDPPLAAWIVAQAAAGLHAAHELVGEDGEPLGLVHRDVSPENVLLSFEGRVKIADFGVAKLAEADRATQSGVVKGKFAYLSPEQARAERLDRRSDVFALGIVLHEAILNRRLFAAGSPAETIRRIGDEKPARLDVERPEVPAALADIAAKSLEKDPAERFATADAMGQALRAHLRGGRPVDDTDLAALLTRVFAADREAMAARFRQALAGERSASEPPAREPPPETGRTEPSMETSIQGVPKRGRRGVLAIALVAAVVALVVWAGFGRHAEAPLPPRAASAAPVDATEAPPALPPPPTAAEPTPTETASAIPPPSARPTAHHVRPWQVPLPAASASTSAAPSHKGQPFRSLGN